MNVYRLIKNDKNIYIIWMNHGTQTIDFREEMAVKLKCTDGHGISSLQLSKNLAVSEEPLFVEFHSKSKSFTIIDIFERFFQRFPWFEKILNQIIT